MIHDLKAYPAYKDSGVPWLGRVPEHWTTKPLKRWVRINAAVLPETTLPQCEFRYLDIGAVETGFLTRRPCMLRFEGSPSRARRIVRKGDTIVSTVRTYLKAVYFVADDAEDLICSTGFAVLTPQLATLPKFVSYLVQSSPFTDRVTADSVGIAYPAIAESRLGSFNVVVPPLPEQGAIVRFLNHYDRKIRRYIRGKQKSAKLLDEERLAIIHRAVTRGLDPNVRLKHSGVGWLGDVPEHWQIAQVRSVAQVVRGGTPRPAGSPVYFHGDAEPWITVGELTKDRDMYLCSTATRLTAVGVERSRTVLPGTLLLTNSGATLGVPKITMIRGCINDGVAAFLRVHPEVNKEYLYFFWTTQTPHLRAWVDLGAQPNLNTQIIGGWPVPMPPPLEQQAIADWVGSHAHGVTRSVDAVQREIGLLREHRTRLIADVVTGKLDVREAAARLPEEAEGPEPLDEDEALSVADEEPADDLDATPREAGV